MRIRVKLFAGLAGKVAEARTGVPFDKELGPGSTLGDLVETILPGTETRLTFVNGRAESPSYRLKEDDEVGIFPVIGGG